MVFVWLVFLVVFALFGVFLLGFLGGRGLFVWVFCFLLWLVWFSFVWRVLFVYLFVFPHITAAQIYSNRMSLFLLPKDFSKTKFVIFVDLFSLFRTGLDINTSLERLHSFLCLQWVTNSFLVLVPKPLTVNQVGVWKEDKYAQQHLRLHKILVIVKSYACTD